MCGICVGGVQNNSLGDVVATYTTTNTSSTTVIQTGLQCDTLYYIGVNVTGSGGLHPTVINRPVRVFVGGEEIVWMRFNHSVMVALSL